MYVLAITVLDKEWDGRISQSNKNWAKMQPIFTDHDEMGNERRRAFVVRSHPGLIDLFLREVRYEKAVSMEKKTLNPDKTEKRKGTVNMAGRAREIQVIFSSQRARTIVDSAENGADGCTEHAGIPAQDGD